MKRRAMPACLMALLLALTASAHDLFLKLDSYFLEPNSKATVRVLNGNFKSSDGLVARERFQDVKPFCSGSPQVNRRIR